MSPELKKQCENAGIPTTTDELLEWLPQHKNACTLTLYKFDYSDDKEAYYCAGYFSFLENNPQWYGEEIADTSADALAKLALWVKEQEEVRK